MSPCPAGSAGSGPKAKCSGSTRCRTRATSGACSRRSGTSTRLSRERSWPRRCSCRLASGASPLCCASCLSPSLTHRSLLSFGSSLLPAIVRAKSWKELRSALTTAPLIDRSVAAFVWPIGLYLALFSLLPHKELRFVFNAIPMLNMAAAVVRLSLSLASHALALHCTRSLLRLALSRSHRALQSSTERATRCVQGLAS